MGRGLQERKSPALVMGAQRSKSYGKVLWALRAGFLQQKGKGDLCEFCQLTVSM